MALAGIVANAEKNTIVVSLASGEKTQIYLYDDIVATFTPDGMVFKSQRVDVSIARNEIKSFDFIETSGVNDIATQDVKIEISAAGINIHNLPNNSIIQVYTVAGTEVFATQGNGDVAVPGDKLTNGIYIVRINNSTYKVNLK